MPYIRALGQELLPGDKERRFVFCNFILNKQRDNSSFISDIVWTDECKFTRQGVVLVITQNCRYWVLQNLHTLQLNRHGL